MKIPLCTASICLFPIKSKRQSSACQVSKNSYPYSVVTCSPHLLSSSHQTQNITQMHPPLLKRQDPIQVTTVYTYISIVTHTEVVLQSGLLMVSKPFTSLLFSGNFRSHHVQNILFFLGYLGKGCQEGLLMVFIKVILHFTASHLHGDQAWINPTGVLKSWCQELLEVEKDVLCFLTGFWSH